MAEQLKTLADIDTIMGYTTYKNWEAIAKCSDANPIMLNRLAMAGVKEALQEEARKWLTALDNMEKEEQLLYKTQQFIRHFFNIEDK